mmetsp:Transcript_34922/g.65772  ORF Transcript_34922/g.65772 Transcript_34922/m.65772 type:complete len:273 (-) Transcript_34922:1274-2092(-)
MVIPPCLCVRIAAQRALGRPRALGDEVVVTHHALGGVRRLSQRLGALRAQLAGAAVAPASKSPRGARPAALGGVRIGEEVPHVAHALRFRGAGGLQRAGGGRARGAGVVRLGAAVGAHRARQAVHAAVNTEGEGIGGMANRTLTHVPGLAGHAVSVQVAPHLLCTQAQRAAIQVQVAAHQLHKYVILSIPHDPRRRPTVEALPLLELRRLHGVRKRRVRLDDEKVPTPQTIAVSVHWGYHEVDGLTYRHRVIGYAVLDCLHVIYTLCAERYC